MNAQDMIDKLEKAESRAKSADARRVLRDERMALAAALQRPKAGKRPTCGQAYDLRTGRTTPEFEGAQAHDRAAEERAQKPSVGALVVEAKRVLDMWEGL